MSREQDDPIHRDIYSENVLDEITDPPTDPVSEAKRRDVDDPADVPIDPEEWRNGGPTRTPGVQTTTGGRRAGPASRSKARPPRQGKKVAPTTTGDATSGGFDSPIRTSTSDATTGAAEAGNFTDR
jgi:hypothetical protein